MPLPVARGGLNLEIGQREIAFSLWPVGRATRRYRVQHRLFAADPWPLIYNEIEERCTRRVKKSAQSFCAQAEDFYKTSFHGRELYAKPLLLYYSMLNLAKAFILATNNGAANYQPHHGLSENATARQDAGAIVRAVLRQNQPSAFNDFLFSVAHRRLTATRSYRLGSVLPQILTGHRIWCAAANASERFIAVDNASFLTQPAQHLIWARLAFRDGDVRRLNLSYSQLLGRSRLGNGWRMARVDDASVCLERINPHTFGHRPSDDLMDVVTEIRSVLWSSVLLVPPYARHYLYLAPPNERAQVLPQLLSIYMIMFFLGSITRYRPHHFETLQEGLYGPFIESFLSEAPSQFLYLLASEFLQQEISKPATV